VTLDLQGAPQNVDGERVGTLGETAPDAVQPARRAKRPTGRVLGLVLILALVGSAFWFAVVANPPDLPIGMRIPWWLLALMFAATELWVFHIQVGREAQAISISEIPIVLALFYAMPQDLLIARVVGPALVMLLHRRQTMLKAAVNIALLYADTAVALAVFCWVGGGSTADSGPTWVAAVLAASAAMAVDLIVINTIIRWYDGGPRLARVRTVINGVGIATASATLGLVPLLTLRLGSLAAVPLLAAGVVLMVGYRAYASLADRHSSLERLFSFSRELNVVPDSHDVLPSVLAQARDLLRGETAEIVRFDEPGVTAWRSVGGRAQLLPPGEADEAGEMVRRLLEGQEPLLLRSDHEAGADYLVLRNAGEALLAPLRYDGRMVGAIAVHDRLGEVRGFSADDLQLLQTVANHASVALHNEMLIGRLRHDALHDTLTGLANRAQLVNEATAQLLHARTRQQSIAVMIIDLNGFKTVNDTLGHHVGDELLRHVANRFVVAAGDDVTVARLGGDEFAILCQARDADAAMTVAMTLLASLVDPFVVDQERLHLSGSAGIAMAPEHGTTVGDLLKRADIAMYAAKNGPDSALVYRSDIDLNDPSLLSLMGELREGIATGQVDIEVEPVVDLFTGAVISAEALVRWHHPTRGKLRPGLFLPLAERNGLIVPLTELVLDRAVAACASWRAAGGDEIGISVNLSARSLLDTMLPRAVADVLRRHHLPSHLLTLEITETIMLSDADRALGLLADLRALGVRLSLDDFGTGYSSLTHLSELPIQQLKIDQSFVSQITRSDRDSAIVEAVASLARHLDVEVVAEGIETAETLARLRVLGCQYGQGHYFAQSMSADLLPLWMSTRPPVADTLPTAASRRRLLRPAL
jgi:diguanylate cyclase (GGDEF)-like protein